MNKEFPTPGFFQRERLSSAWRVDYETRFRDALQWKRQYQIPDASADRQWVALLLVDVQNTFCLPGFELFVGGRSGTAAVDDNERLVTFIYRNLARITRTVFTMDTHTAIQIFHPIFWVGADGSHPAPYTVITAADVADGVWRVNPAIAGTLRTELDVLQRHALHYTQQLEQNGKYALAIWPYHAMLGGIGHAIVSGVEEAAFFHQVARSSQSEIQLKGNSPLTEHYSVLRPEVLHGADGAPIGQKNSALIESLLSYDAIIVAGQAKSHCVAWTVADLLSEIQQRDPALAGKVYLLEDCTSPVVVPDVIDYTDAANAAYERFAQAGMRIVRSTDPMEGWLDG